MSVQHLPLAPALRYAWLGDAYVDFTANRLARNGRERRLTPKAAGVLRELVQRENRVVRRDDLLGLVWRDGFPTDDVLTRAVKELRRALDDDPRAPKLIETIPRVGYRLRMVVRVVDAPSTAGATTTATPARAQAHADGDAGADRDPDRDTDATDHVATAAPDAGPSLAVARSRALDDVAAGDAANDGMRETDALAVDAPPAGRRQSIPSLRTGVVVAVLLLIAAAWFLAGARRTPSPPIAPRATAPAEAPRLNAPTPVAVTSDPGGEYFPAISPDGAMIAFAASAPDRIESALAVKGRDPAAKAQILVPVTKGRFMAHLTWSPDGSGILYADLGDGPCEMRIVPASGGTPRTVAPCDAGAMDGFDFSPDASQVLVSQPAANEGAGARVLSAITLRDGSITTLTYAPRAPGDVDLYPRVSPDGRWIAFRRGLRPYADLWIMPREGGTARPLATLGSWQRGMSWMADSRHLVVSSDHEGAVSLFRVSIDDGTVTPLGIDNAQYPSVSRRANYVAYMQPTEWTQLVAFELDAAGRADAGRRIAPSSRADHSMTVSPSGDRVAFVSERSGTPQVWVHDLVADQTTMVSDETRAIPDYPQWSPDERELLYVSRGKGTSRLVRVDLATRRHAFIGGDDERIRFGSYAADGASILYASDRGGTWDAWRMRRDGTGATRLTHAGALDPRQYAGDPHVYYCKLSMTGVFRLDPATGREELVTRRAAYVMRGSLQPVGGALWLYRRNIDGSGTVLTRAIAGGVDGDATWRETSTLRFAGGSTTVAASFDGSRRRLVTPMVLSDDTDVLVAELPDGG